MNAPNDSKPIITWGIALLMLMPGVLAGIDVYLGETAPYVVQLKLWNEAWIYVSGVTLFLFLVDLRSSKARWMALGRWDFAIITFLLVQSLWLSRTVAADTASADVHLLRIFLALSLGVAAYYAMQLYQQRFALPVYYAAIIGAALVTPFLLFYLFFQEESRALGEGLKWYIPGFGPVRLLGITAEVGIALGAGLLAIYTGQKRNWLIGLAMICLWALLFWSGGRGAFLSILVSLLITSLLSPMYFVVLWRAALLTGTGGAAISLLIWVPDGTVFGLKNMIGNTTQENINSVSHGRVARWNETLEIALQRPIFGHGLNQYSNLWPFYAIDDAKNGNEGQMPFYFLTYRNTHNIVVEAILSWGIFGATLFFGLLLKAWFKAAAKVKTAVLPERIPAFIALNTLGIHALFTGVYIFPHSLFYVAIFFGICLAPKPAQNENTSM